jgi:ubiquitin-conjugating enzyme E2 variant
MCVRAGSDAPRRWATIERVIPPASQPPAVADLSRAQRILSALWIAAAGLLLVALAVRAAAGGALWHWSAPPLVLLGMAAADLASGLVHWGADTWGRDDLPVIGPRLLVPFRVHHVNPDDFLRRSVLDTNGEVAAVATLALAAFIVLPLDGGWGRALVVFALGFCGAGMLTNQIHQWAHMPRPPRAVRALQAAGVILGPHAHARHHAHPYDRRYCITTGWCNAPLEAVGFFRRLEAAVTSLTGAEPRTGDREYETHFGRVAGGEPGRG